VVPSAAAGTSERERTTDSTAVAPREATLGVRERVVLPGAGAPAYSTTRIASPAEPVADDIVDRLLASRPSWRERRDGRLDRLAATLLAIAIEHEALGASIVDEARSFQGVPEPTPVAVYLARGELATLVRELGVALSEVGAGLDRFGIAARAEAGGWRVLGVASRQSVEIEPVPRHVAASGALELIGRLLVPVRSLALVVTRPDGTVTRLPVTIQARQRFSVRLDLPAPGRHTVEVVAVDPRGPRPILILPVHVGEPPPSGVELAVTGLESRDPGELEAHLLALVNAARQEAGLPPVSPHPGLADVARRYSNEMARTGQVAHVSSRSGGIADR